MDVTYPYATGVVMGELRMPRDNGVRLVSTDITVPRRMSNA